MLIDIINKHGLEKTAIACGVTTGAVRGWKSKGSLPGAVSKAARLKLIRYERGLAKLENKTVPEIRKDLKESE